MKKIILVLSLFAFKAKAQTIDTVLVRNLQMQGQDWAYVVGKNIDHINTDSASAKEFRRIRDRIRTINPASWTTNVTVDSIPGWVAFAFYKTVKSANAGEIVARYSAITAAIESKNNMTSFLNSYNAILLSDFNRSRDRGKSVVIDN